MDTIGTRLKQWRKSNNLPMTEVCKKANIAQSALSDYENDKSIPGGKILLQLYRSFDIDIQFILTGEHTQTLTTNQQELLDIFDKLPEREQIKFIGRMEEALIKYKGE